MVLLLGAVKIPLLLIGKPLDHDQGQLNRNVSQVAVCDVRFELGCKQDCVDRCGEQEKQHALDERDEGPIEDMESKFGDMLADNLPDIYQSCARNLVI